MKKKVYDILCDEIIKTVTDHIYWHTCEKPTIQTIHDVIDYHYSDDVKDFMIRYNIFKILYQMNFKVKAIDEA